MHRDRPRAALVTLKHLTHVETYTVKKQTERKENWRERKKEQRRKIEKGLNKDNAWETEKEAKEKQK